MKKDFLKFISNALSKPIVRIFIYAVAILFLLFIYASSGGLDAAWNEIFAIIKSEVTVSVFFAGMVSVLVAQIVKLCDYYLEESLKISDNHHDIINKYSEHKKRLAKNPDTEAVKDNFVDKTGVQMAIRDKHVAVFSKKDIKNTESDHYSTGYKNMRDALKEYQEGTLYLPSINMFANTTGKTQIVFEDTNRQNNTPPFILDNAMSLMAAHKNSVKSNTNTIRLRIFPMRIMY